MSEARRMSLVAGGEERDDEEGGEADRRDGPVGEGNVAERDGFDVFHGTLPVAAREACG